MDKRVILAVAGSGKTYHICNNIDINKRNIIIAYTNQNIKNIINELSKKFGYIPDNTIVMTFHSFIYKFMIRPFDTFIGEVYKKENFRSKGISIVKPPEQSIAVKGKYRKNPKYRPNTTLEHYLEKDKYYCEYLSKLILKTKSSKYKLIDIACTNISNFFDYVYIDEMQDFREENWKLVKEIIERVDNILLVGDYNQHSTNALNNHGIPFKDKGYIEYKEYLRSLGVTIDDQTLIRSRRCSIEVCNFIREKLKIEICGNIEKNGKVIWLKNESDIHKILNDNSVVKLVYELPEKYMFPSITWGYSKGDTYKNTCVILTGAYSDLEKEGFSNKNSIISTNKLYVALTRSEGNVYIIKKETLDSLYNKK